MMIGWFTYDESRLDKVRAKHYWQANQRQDRAGHDAEKQEAKSLLIHMSAREEEAGQTRKVNKLKMSEGFSADVSTAASSDDGVSSSDEDDVQEINNNQSPWPYLDNMHLSCLLCKPKTKLLSTAKMV